MFLSGETYLYKKKKVGRENVQNQETSEKQERNSERKNANKKAGKRNRQIVIYVYKRSTQTGADRQTNRQRDKQIYRLYN